METEIDMDGIARKFQRKYVASHNGNPEEIIDIINIGLASENIDDVIRREEEMPMYNETPNEYLFSYFSPIIGEMVAINKIVGGIRGKNIIEIGCGAKISRDSYQPTHARILSEIGANVIGIDINPSSNEPYKHIVADLTKRTIGEVIPEDFSTEVVIARCFFDSPTLREIIGKNARPFTSKIFSQVYDILPKGGIFFTHPRDFSDITRDFVIKNNQRISAYEEACEFISEHGFEFVGCARTILEGYRKV